MLNYNLKLFHKMPNENQIFKIKTNEEAENNPFLSLLI